MFDGVRPVRTEAKLLDNNSQHIFPVQMDATLLANNSQHIFCFMVAEA